MGREREREKEQGQTPQPHLERANRAKQLAEKEWS